MPAAFGRSIGAASENEAGGAQSLVLTTTAVVNAGEKIRVFVGFAQDLGWLSSPSVTSITDTAGNTYAIEVTSESLERKVVVFCANAPSGLASGQTITVNTSLESPTTVRVVACCDTGALLASNEDTDSGTAASPAALELDPVTSGGIAYGATINKSNIGGTEASGWTNVNSALNTTPNFEMRVAYRLTEGASIAYDPAFSGSTQFAGLMADFGEGLDARRGQRLPILGVG